MNRIAGHARGEASWLQVIESRIGEQEFRRRLWHFLPGVIAFGLSGVPHLPTIRLWVMLLLVAFGVMLPAWLAIRYHKRYCRSKNENIVPSILGYVIPVSILALLFRSNVAIPLGVAGIIAFGDGSATLLGLLTQGRRIPWNTKKSWAGLFGFVLVGTVLASTIFWIAAPSTIGLLSAMLCVGPVVLVCALLESLPLKMNDNLTVGLTSAVLLPMMSLLVFGW